MERKLGKLFIFASNSESDQALLQKVVQHLDDEAQRAGLSLFHQGRLAAGDLLSSCRQHLLDAPVAVALLSMSLLGDKVSRPLLDEAVARSQSGALRLVPAMASDVDLHQTAFEGLHVLFHERPLYRVEHLDEALVKLRLAVRSALHAAQSLEQQRSGLEGELIDLFDVWGTGPTDVWAAGRAGVVVRHIGSAGVASTVAASR